LNTLAERTSFSGVEASPLFESEGTSVEELQDMVIKLDIENEKLSLLAAQNEPGTNIYWVQGVHLNPLGLFLCTTMPCISSIMSPCLPT
jgi:hypothetical protein